MIPGNNTSIFRRFEMKNYFFVLGASDPEMDCIQGILKEKAIPYIHAKVRGKRVLPVNAYKATDEGIHPAKDEITVNVECAVPGYKFDITCDHHNPGDPGFDKTPEQFWEGSSLGQVCNLLNIEPTKEMLLVAAGDHCPFYAYSGRCPGVDPGELMDHRLAIKSKHQNRPVYEIVSDVVKAIGLIQEKLNNGEVIPHFEETVNELPEASLRVGKAVSYTLIDHKTGRAKVGILNGVPPVIDKWMKEIAPKMGLIDIYGNANRGYAGGYRP